MYPYDKGGITVNNGIVEVSFRFEFYDIPEVERERRASFNDISIDQVYQTKCNSVTLNS